MSTCPPFQTKYQFLRWKSIQDWLRLVPIFVRIFACKVLLQRWNYRDTFQPVVISQILLGKCCLCISRSFISEVSGVTIPLSKTAPTIIQNPCNVKYAMYDRSVVLFGWSFDMYYVIHLKSIIEICDDLVTSHLIAFIEHQGIGTMSSHCSDIIPHWWYEVLE